MNDSSLRGRQSLLRFVARSATSNDARGSDHYRWKQWFAASAALTDIVRTVLPEMERLRVATANEIEIDTLAERICAEMTANESVIVGRGETAAWSKIETLKRRS
ncbi:MAG TPA: hypothetical protein VIV66_02215 [Pyrinomonadaceae bacterium]